MTVIDRALAQIPDAQVDDRHPDQSRFGWATHQTADHCHSCDLRFSFGYELTEPVRSAILETPEQAWIPALDQDDGERTNGQVVELTDRVELSLVAGGFAGDRPPRTPAPRRATLLHRP